MPAARPDSPRGRRRRIHLKSLEVEVRPLAKMRAFLQAGFHITRGPVAFDLNVSEDPFGAQPRIDPRVVEVMERWASYG